MTMSDAGIYRAPKHGQNMKAGITRKEIGGNVRYNDQYTEIRDSRVSDTQADKTTVFAKIQRSNCSDIRLADMLV